MDHEQLIQLFIENGAHKAGLVHQSDIVTSTEFRDICAGNGCGNYGKCWMCPPDVGEIGPMMEQLRRYPYGILYQTIGQLEDSYDFEGMTAAGDAHAQVSQRIQRAVQRPLKQRAYGLLVFFLLLNGQHVRQARVIRERNIRLLAHSCAQLPKRRLIGDG